MCTFKSIAPHPFPHFPREASKSIPCHTYLFYKQVDGQALLTKSKNSIAMLFSRATLPVNTSELIAEVSAPCHREGRWQGPASKGQRRYDMNGRFQMTGGKNWILPKDMTANRFFWGSHWLEIWSNHLCP